ncbi:MAG: MFS transporter, partial [Moraxellaceae bacterium]
KYAFYIGGIILLLSVCWTAYSTKEYSPRDMESFRQYRTQLDIEYDDAAPDFFRTGIYFLIPGILASLLIALFQLSEQLYVLTIGIAACGIAQLTAGFMRKHGRTHNGFYHVTQDLLNMPETMKQLALVQFLSWFALFSLWIYGTAAVTSFHFGTTDTSSAAYNQGADWVGVLFATYNGCAAIAAIFIPIMISLTNRKITHMINLCLGGISLIAFAFIKDPTWLLAPMLSLGFAWASILSLPYAMLSNAVPGHKMGIYAGLFNFFIVIPQILAASILAVVVHHLFHQQTIYALVSGGGFMFLAAIATFFVNEHAVE